MRHFTAIALAALGLAACGPPPVELAPLSRTDIETLPAGAGCSFERDGDILLVAMLENGAAVVRTADGLMGLGYRGEELFDGGRFAPDGRGPEVEVAVTGPESEEPYVTSQAAVITVDGRADPEPGEWVCGD